MLNPAHGSKESLREVVQMMFIRLTGANGKDLYVNIDRIRAVQAAKSHEGQKGASIVYLDQGQFEVLEPVEDVLDKIRTAHAHRTLKD